MRFVMYVVTYFLPQNTVTCRHEEHNSSDLTLFSIIWASTTWSSGLSFFLLSFRHACSRVKPLVLGIPLALARPRCTSTELCNYSASLQSFNAVAVSHLEEIISPVESGSVLHVCPQANGWRLKRRDNSSYYSNVTRLIVHGQRRRSPSKTRRTSFLPALKGLQQQHPIATSHFQDNLKEPALPQYL